MAKRRYVVSLVIIGGSLLIMIVFYPNNNFNEQFYPSKIGNWSTPVSSLHSLMVFETRKNITNNNSNQKFERSNNTFKNINLIVSDELLHIKRIIIKPLHYSDLEEPIRNLLLKRKCNSFPCNQIFQKNNFQNQFQIRNVIANESCKVTRHLFVPMMRWELQKSLTPPTRNFRVCTIPKVGFMSWMLTMKNLRHIKSKHNKASPHVITVRHPFDRLAAAYRDKFLNGEPLTTYSERYKSKTNSHQSWIIRWRTYWLPALISRCLIIPSKKYIDIFSKIVNAYHKFKTYLQKKSVVFSYSTSFITNILNTNNSEVMDQLNTQSKIKDKYRKRRSLKNVHGNQNSGIIYKTITNNSQFFNVKIKKRPKTHDSIRLQRILNPKYTIPITIKKMTLEGNQYGMRFFSANGYNKIEENSIIESMKNSIFSFQNFLEHLIWTYEIGLEDTHWSTYQTICNVCYKKYDYILHLNNIDEESKQLLSDVGYPLGTSIASIHRVSNSLNISTKNENNINTTPQSNYSNKYINYDYDTKYYQDIPKEIIEKLRQIYFRDLLIFGYSIP